ncbi:hypothetical protein [Sphingopyxis sp. 113P3]|uniref:hypothetical protein n=1 Tax=Sphingopyxis sp. (strain 113P3) TaxID=292913 RepID=UPI00130DFD26|nr:hypothetical protein [Sphingopyxis sp. 113P3]
MAEAAGLTVTALREKIGFVEAEPTGGYAAGVVAIEKDVPEEIKPLSGKVTAKPKK